MRSAIKRTVPLQGCTLQCHNIHRLMLLALTAASNLAEQHLLLLTFASFCVIGSSKERPINLFVAKTVLCGLVTACQQTQRALFGGFYNRTAETLGMCLARGACALAQGTHSQASSG